MTSELNHGDGSNASSASKPIHFFRILLPENLLDGKLRIPAKFVRKYGQNLSNTIFLKLPNGVEWKVNLEKNDDGVWFQKGWKEFVEHHSLAYGHLLFFRYDGTSIFHVLICDMSTLEIDYPSFNKVDRKRANNSGEFQQNKAQKTSGNKEFENVSDLQDNASHHPTARDCKCWLKNISNKKSNIINQHTGKSSSLCISTTIFGAHDEDVGNTCFSVTIKPSHLTSWCMMLPKGSLKGYIKPGGQNVTLVVGDDRSWKVNLIHYQNQTSSFFSAGWSAFARENALKAGDNCLFQLIKISHDEMLIKVSISNKHSSVS